MSLEVTSSESADRTPIWRRNTAGEIELVEAPPSEFYVDPQPGEYEVLQVTGISEMFEREKDPKYRKEGEDPLQHIRIWEITVRKGKNLNGRTFSVWINDKYVAGTKESNGAKIIRGIRGYPVGKSERMKLDEFIGNATTHKHLGIFHGMVGKSEGGKPKITDVIVNTAPQQAELVAAPAASAAPAQPSVFDQPDDEATWGD
jgi:hypothetical protein